MENPPHARIISTISTLRASGPVCSTPPHVSSGLRCVEVGFVIRFFQSATVLCYIHPSVPGSVRVYLQAGGCLLVPLLARLRVLRFPR